MIATSALAVALAAALVASYLPKEHAGAPTDVVQLGPSPTFALDTLLGSTPTVPLTGRTLPSANLKVLSGSPGTAVELSHIAAGRPLVVNVWSSACVPCQRETPDLVALWHDLQGSGQVAFVGIDVSDTVNQGLSFLRRFGGIDAYPMLSDPSGSVAYDLGVTRLPTTLIVDPDGRVVDVRYAAVTGSEVRSLLRQHFGLT